jgi:UPF0755 protein
MRRAPVLVLLLACTILTVILAVPALAAHAYGPPARGLSSIQVLQYSARLLWDDGLLTRATDPEGPVQDFEVQQGESIASISDRLESARIISGASTLRDYLIYTGLDTSVQAGTYRVGPAMSIVDIARRMQDATPEDVTFVILPGWRMEEAAASLPTSGLEVTPDEFVSAASAPRSDYDFLVGAPTTEGFLYPDSYVLPRATTAAGLVDALLRGFSLHLDTNLVEGFRRQGLSIYQAVTVASIVQREAVDPAEAPLIASVYLNRLKIGMRLEADPTVQYALGYNAAHQTWWTNPLSLDDLHFSSAYNTYANDGLPPTPIDNPGLGALQAVAFPANTPYYYFRARCDQSGTHAFSQTFEEHLQNICP